MKNSKKYDVVFYSQAETEIVEAANWYAIQRAGLEAMFAKEIDDTIETIMQMPFIFRVRYKNIRIARAKKFPYNVHYFVDKERDLIVITGVIHSCRKDAVELSR
ncbi:MAG: type II toxin-antitoxin system RelE/ParE family toxin [Bacteroidales bacterium]|jgi:mRNA-degrading endonuclease RelE of RelBE toxin-antitoxin system|nr:type II toxin-antitoxin system RelE/ParE family toxin [Bacteroidales bacterium]